MKERIISFLAVESIELIAIGFDSKALSNSFNAFFEFLFIYLFIKMSELDKIYDRENNLEFNFKFSFHFSIVNSENFPTMPFPH